MQRTILRGFDRWPKKASFGFRYGRFEDASVDPWPRGYRDLFLMGEVDSHEVRVWRQVLRSGDTVIDAGANLGYWTLVAARLVGPKGRVLAFEPVPRTFASLRRNVEASETANVELRNEALEAKDGTIEISLADDDPAMTQASAGRGDGISWSGSVSCLTRSLDSVLGGAPVRLLKLDIEGGELAALQGADRLLSSGAPPVVTFEWNVSAAGSLGYHPTATLELLEKRGYSFFRAMTTGLVPLDAHPPDSQSPMVWAFPAGVAPPRPSVKPRSA